MGTKLEQKAPGAPSAPTLFVKSALASTASRPALMTLRNAPLWDGTESIYN